MENAITKFLGDKSSMQEICTIEKGPTIVGAWGKDTGTMERRLKLAFVYPDGEISPIKEYSQSKLSDAKALKDLADLDGVKPELITDIYSAIMKKMETLAVQTDSDGKCSLREAYRTLVSTWSSTRNPVGYLSKMVMGISLPTTCKWSWTSWNWNPFLSLRISIHCAPFIS